MDFTNHAVQSPGAGGLGCGCTPACGTLPGHTGLPLQPPASRQENANVVQLWLSRGKHLHSPR